MAEADDDSTPEAVTFDRGEKPLQRSDKRYLEMERAANGGLADDPTDSGAPVKNRHSFKVTR